MAFKASLHWRTLIGCVLALGVAAFLVPYGVKAPAMAESRPLADLPSLPAAPGDFAAFRADLDAYVADRFPPRAHLIAALNLARLRLGVSGTARVAVGRQGWLFHDDGSHFATARGDPPLSDAAASAWLANLAGRSEALAARGGAYLVVVPPNKESIYPQFAPAWGHGRDASRAPAATLGRLARRAGAGEVLDLGPDIARQAGYGLKVFSPLDSHWTGLGAYVGYATIMKRLQELGLSQGPRPLEDFVERPAGEAAPPRDLALMLGVASFLPNDYPQLADPEAESRLRVTYLTQERGWTAPRVIYTGMTGKPSLLITVDSFSNALLPFLYGDFRRIIVAHNQDGGWRQDLIETFRPDIVITEVVESGLVPSMRQAPAPSPQALHRIVATVRDWTSDDRREAARAMAARQSIETRLGLRLTGGPGPDALSGGNAADDINGGPGDDRLAGGRGDDLLRGGRGADRVSGGAGNDWVEGGRDDDTISGGPGADTFHVAADAGLDRIIDFSPAEGDGIELDPGAAYSLIARGGDTEVRVGQGARILLVGVTRSALEREAIWRSAR